MKNRPTRDPGSLISYQVTVGSVQRVRGLDFFDVLPDKKGTQLKHPIDSQWLSEAVKSRDSGLGIGD